MPLIKREVEPVLVSQVDIGPEVKNELECVTNFTLSSIIRQLANLGRHAEDIFGDLYQEALGLCRRADAMSIRVEKLNDTVNKLDPLKDSGTDELRVIKSYMQYATWYKSTNQKVFTCWCSPPISSTYFSALHRISDV